MNYTEAAEQIKANNLNITDGITAASLEASGPVKGGELTTGGNVILSGGGRNWILHNNGTNLYVAPSNTNKNNWEWGKQTVYYPDGKILAKMVDTSDYLRYKGRNAITNGDLLNIINAKNNYGLHASHRGDGVHSNTNCSAHHVSNEGHGPTSKSYCHWEIRKVGERPNANPAHIGR